jgi:hypothetical protein
MAQAKHNRVLCGMANENSDHLAKILFPNRGFARINSQRKRGRAVAQPPVSAR